ncbi:hypothetical protein PMZ80_006648 [Knufia obscura]|uniref:Uncharacterized protein n=2 Tax=Knufia TaxID=430999 RepID=A0AAN8IKC1_9EURO|nr:hypothetical protein PMZ80_006648 [Knufia obscura]KAK5951007.1 hypothetical protein OHC33_008079 [Knufia fluminis]
MSSRPKAFLKQAKAKKKKEQILDDADDYLAAAVDNEDAVGKHRAGDPLKSLRFARRAIELYQEGLAKWPRNLDLAYNKARLELEIATHPLLAKHLDVPVIDVLYESLNSHQYALSLDHDNADALFNIAQVLTSIAEHIAKDDSMSDTEALNFLEQALEYQSRCLSLQERKYAETRDLYQEAAGQSSGADADDDGGARIGTNTRSIYEEQEHEQEEQWVSVVEPVTIDTLVDTILSQLSTLTTLCSVLSTSRHWRGRGSNASTASSPVSLSGIEACSTKANEMLQVITRTENIASRTHEIALTKAILAGNLLELAYRSGSIDIGVYKSELEKAFAAQGLDTSDAQISYARTLLALNAAATDSGTGVPLEVENQDFANLRWNALSKAQKVLTSAASLSKTDTETLATTHMLRGDTSLLLLALAYPPTSFTQAATNANQLLKNAEVFYRNAHKLFGTLADGQDERDIAGLRGAVVLILQRNNGGNALWESTQGGARDVPRDSSQGDARDVLRGATQSRKDDWRNDQLQDMIDEGLVQPEALRML